MKILGVDPSISCTGYAIFDTDKQEFIEYKYILTPKALSNHFDKALFVSKQLFDACNIYSVDKIIFEGYAFGSRKFGGHNHNLIEFIGIVKYILYTSYIKDDEIILMPPKTARKLVLDNGNADKNMVYDYFNTTYKLNFNPPTKAERERLQNITDAMILCVAYQTERRSNDKKKSNNKKHKKRRVSKKDK